MEEDYLTLEKGGRERGKVLIETGNKRERGRREDNLRY